MERERRERRIYNGDAPMSHVLIEERELEAPGPRIQLEAWPR